MVRHCSFAFAVTISLAVSQVSQANAADDAQARAAARAKAVYALWGTDPAVVAAVKAFNTAPPEGSKSMTQQKWKELSVISPEVRALTRNDLATYLRTKKDDAVVELFVSGADGTKVAFLGKPTNWCHKGKPKHDKPMAGQTWVGATEVDESTGKLEVQVAVPVLDGGKAIGSIVVGLDATVL
jgi:hypothetical protein